MNLHAHPITRTLRALVLIGATTLLPAHGQSPTLTESGKTLAAQYQATLDGLKAEITKSLPAVPAQKKAAYEKASADFRAAEAAAAEAQKNLGQVGTAKALVAHALGKWIGGADKGIAAAQEALKKATTPAQREAAEKELAKWQANREDGVKALKEREAAYEQAKRDEPALKKAHEAAQAALAKTRTAEREAATAILSELAPVIGTDRLDPKLAQATILTAATPSGLAQFAQQSSTHAALLTQLFANTPLMLEMLTAGGASHGEYGRAMEIYAAIRKASPQAASGHLQRLALATSLEHAKPIPQSSSADEKPSAPAFIDPVKRYLHYEKAFLNGELDPAFKTFTTWEYRHVVNCDAPDEILAWGREMLRTYRPDHIYNPDYGWRYVSSVRTEVPYGSQNVQYDLPSLHQYQNIIMNGGVCGRRAFFGRFILRSFGIPTWGVTQHKHAALSHWTPKGWVINLGAGFQASWWDKDEVSLSGNQFLIETQARVHTAEYLRVLRAQWISRILGEQPFNDRRKIAGGFWSSTAHLYSVMLSEKATALGPLGQELAEANEKEQKLTSAAVSAADQKIQTAPDGSLTLPAVAHGRSSGKASTMKSFGEGMQLHALGGFKTTYEVTVPKAGTYHLSARIATVQTGQEFLISTADSTTPLTQPVPYTKGLWQQTTPVELTLQRGKNTIHFELKPGSRGVTLKDFTLAPAAR